MSVFSPDVNDLNKFGDAAIRVGNAVIKEIVETLLPAVSKEAAGTEITVKTGPITIDPITVTITLSQKPE